jgi:hypothetical protein
MKPGLGDRFFYAESSGWALARSDRRKRRYLRAMPLILCRDREAATKDSKVPHAKNGSFV